MFGKIVTLQVLSLVFWLGNVDANSDHSPHGVRDFQSPSCVHKSPIQEWTSRLLVEDLLGRSNKREEEDNVNFNKKEEKRRKMKRKGSLQLLIQGHNRTNGKINPRTRYQVELVNSMAREVKALIVIAPVNQTTCGLGILIRNKSEKEKESIIFNDSCHLKAETLLPAKAKRDFSWMTPRCGCHNVSAHFALYTNNKLTIMNPKSSKDTLPNKIVCVGPTLSRAEQMAEVRQRIMRQREAKLQRKRGRRQRPNKDEKQMTNERPMKKKKISSVNAGGNSIGANEVEEAETSDQLRLESVSRRQKSRALPIAALKTTTDAEMILRQIHEEENELELRKHEEEGEEEGNSDTDEENESDESDETSESEEHDEDENGEEDSSPAPVTEGNHIQDETDANAKKGNKKRIQGRNKTNNLKGDKREKIAKRRRNLQKIRREGRRQRMDGPKTIGARGNNFRGLRLCCRQGIKHKKLKVSSHPQENIEHMQGCDEVSSELLTWVKENMKIPERFCSRRFINCCLGWRTSNKEVGASNSIHNAP